MGDTAPRFELPTVQHGTLRVPRPTLLHLQFRRFAGCPVCHLHLHSFARRHDEFTAANVANAAVFHATLTDLRNPGGKLPFPIAADPEKRVYREYGVETSVKALLHPRTWWKGLRGMGQTRQPWRGAGSPLGLPAEFLLDPSGRIVDVHYGTHADDHWDVDQVLERARQARADLGEAAEVAS